VDFGERFFEDFGIGILHSVYGGVAPHHRSPTSANKPAGQDSRALMTPGLDDSTAPIADECQSFLDNVVAQFGRRRAWNDRPGAVRANEVLEVVRSACGDDGLAKKTDIR
jgi:hypothetical protein